MLNRRLSQICIRDSDEAVLFSDEMDVDDALAVDNDNVGNNDGTDAAGPTGTPSKSPDGIADLDDDPATGADSADSVSLDDPPPVEHTDGDTDSHGDDLG